MDTVERLKKLKQERDKRHYRKKKLQTQPIEITEAGLQKCTQCEVFQSSDQYRALGEKSHVGIVSTSKTVCANCHWYNDRYGIDQWKIRQAKKKAGERQKRYEERRTKASGIGGPVSAHTDENYPSEPQ